MPEIEHLKADLHGKGLSPKTIKNVVGTLGKMLGYAQEMGILSGVPRIKHLPVPRKEVEPLEAGELDTLLTVASRNPEWRDMILFAARTGLRYGELCELRWKDVDLDAAKIRVSRSCTRGEVTDRKNHHAYTVPLSPQTVAMLKTRRQLRHLDGERLVFCKPDGGRHIHRRADMALKRLCKKAGLKPIGWHRLRHTFASMLVSRGRTLKEAQELLGHRDYQSTQIYAHLVADQLHGAVAVLDEPPTVQGQPGGNRQEKTV